MPRGHTAIWGLLRQRFHPRYIRMELMGPSYVEMATQICSIRTTYVDFNLTYETYWEPMWNMFGTDLRATLYLRL